jgi:endonuclease/exonuclease/phosphatase family metal-dependent hydrolase
MRPYIVPVAAVALACAASGCRHSAATEPQPGQPSLRVMTFNINFGVAGAPANIEAVRDADADIVLLQETTDAGERAIRAELSDMYPTMAFVHCCRAGGLGILSKHPIVDEEYLPPPQGWFPAWRVVLDTPVGKVQTLNVHLRPPISDGGSWVSGYFTTRDVRRVEIETFWTAMDPALPTLVAGDFNENDDGEALEFLQEQGLRSALPTFAPGARTWRWKTRVGTIRAQLDHIVHDPRLLPLSAEVLERGRSDHMPVVAVFVAGELDMPRDHHTSVGSLGRRSDP